MQKIYCFVISTVLIIILDLDTLSAQNADLGAINLSSPTSPMCAGRQPLRVAIFNYTGITHNFSIDRARITVDVTGASTQSFILNLNSGSIPATSVAQYIVAPQVILTTPGIHHFDVRIDVITGDIDTTNNILPTVDILVNDLPTVNLDTLDNICGNAPAINLTGGSPIGGTYSGNGVSSSMFDPSVAGIGTTTVTYTYIDTNGCEASDSKNIFVNAVPTLTLSSLPGICFAASSFSLNIGSPAGGTYSGTGVSAGMFDPGVSGIGTFSINYAYTDTNGCSDSSYVTQTVYSVPTVTISTIPSVCANTPAFTLSSGSPLGGSYSGTFVSSGMFDPMISGTGTFSVTYVYSDAAGCTDSSMQTLTVNSLPVVSHSSLSDICESAGITVLSGGSPSGGTYTGTGASGAIFNPATAGPGTTPLIYTYMDGAGCSDTAMISINVIASPTVALSAFTPICVNGTPLVLSGGAPSGGFYFGPGISAGSFDPSIATAGTHIISYVYTNTVTTCRDTATNTIVVDSLPMIGLNDTVFCGPTLVLGAGNPGSTYLWSTGATTQTIALTNNTTVYVTVTTAHNCISTDTAAVSFFTAAILFLGEDVEACQGTGVPISACSPTWTSYLWCVGATTCSITAYSSGNYCLTTRDTNGCIVRDTVGITIHPLPGVSLAALSPTFICVNIPPYPLTGGSPTGGTYSGPGVSSGTFDPAAAGIGTHTITYSYTDGNGCTNIDTHTITVGCTGIETNEPDDLIYLYPNPTNGQLNISFDKSENDLQIFISDIQGKILYEELFGTINKGDVRIINTESFANGLYLVTWKTADRSFTRKIIVQH